MALKKYNKIDGQNFEDIQESIVVVRDQIDVIEKIFYRFNNDKYFSGTPLEQLETLNRAVEYVQVDIKTEHRFMQRMKRMKSAYDICSGSDVFSDDERDLIHYYLAIRSILHKLTSGGAPDTYQMNKKVREMIKDAIESEGVEEIFKLGENAEGKLDIFDDSYLAKLDKLKMPNTKFKLLQKMLERAIMDFKAVNKIMGVDFSKQFKLIVEKYNERKENDVLKGAVLEDFTDEIINLYEAMKKEKASYKELGIDFEEKAFYDILLSIAEKYDFSYPEDKLKELAQEVKQEVDNTSKYTDWNKRADIKAELKVHLIILLHKFGYPPAANDEVYKEIFEQAENFKRNLKR
jgi:type I restriction enzyme R subunit